MLGSNDPEGGWWGIRLHNFTLKESVEREREPSNRRPEMAPFPIGHLIDVLTVKDGMVMFDILRSRPLQPPELSLFFSASRASNCNDNDGSQQIADIEKLYLLLSVPRVQHSWGWMVHRG